MLKGANKFVLTHETIRLAVEAYLRAGLVDGEQLTVQSVSETESGSRTYQATKTFDVQVVETMTGTT